MSTASLSAFLRALLSRIFRAGTWKAALTRIFRQLERFLSKILLRRKNGRLSRPPSSDRQIVKSKEARRVQQDFTLLTPQLKPSPESTSPSYTVVHNGDTVCLDGVLASSYPFGSGNIRNTSRTSLRLSDAPDRSRAPSPASIRLTGSHRSAASSTSNIPLQDLTPITSYPFPYVYNGPARNDSLPPNIEVVGDSPTTPNYQPRADPYSAIVEEPDQELDAPVTDNQSMLQVPGSRSSYTHVSPTRGESPAGRSFSHISPEVVSIVASADFLQVPPFVPSETKRYSERAKIKKQKTNMTMEALKFDFSKLVPPSGWTRYAHPEGARYFYHKEKRVYTDAEINDPEILHFLEEKVEEVESFKPPEGFPENADIVLNVYREKVGFSSQYYCINHEKQLLFFLGDFEAQWLESWEGVQGVTSEHHLYYEMTAEYWYFVQLYPHSLKLSKDMVDELRDIILHLIGDSMTSPYSTAQYTLDNLHKILALTGDLEKNVESRHYVGSTGLVARNLFIFNHARFLNFHGESYARIERNFSVYGDKLYKRTLLVKTLSIALFSAPDVHLTSLQKMWVDKVLHKSVWEETMKKMSDEWQEFVFFATVVLNANVAFLAIQTVDHGPPQRSAAQICSYVSVIANVGSIILGLLLMRQNRTKSRDTAANVQEFLLAHNHPLLGLEFLAILFSLPYAFLMWGMVSFLAAFCFMCFEISNVFTRGIVGAVLGATGSLIIWCIRLAWEKRKEEEEIHQTFAYVETANPNGSPNDTASNSGPSEGNETPSQRNTPLPSLLSSFLPTMFGAIRCLFTSKTPHVRNAASNGEV